MAQSEDRDADTTGGAEPLDEDSAVDGLGETEDGPDSGPDRAPAVDARPPARLSPEELIGRYRQVPGSAGPLLSWSWSGLLPAEMDALAEVVDEFVAAYNPAFRSCCLGWTRECGIDLLG